MICKLCNVFFKTWITIDGKTHNLCSRKYCLDCSPFKSHNNKELTEKYQKINKITGICKVCNKEYKIKRCSKTCGSCKVTRRRKKLKQKMLDILGGKCKSCGYNRCPNALDFHHIDPKTKKNLLSNMYSRKWELILEELLKCIILCKNCHGELHSGFISLENDTIIKHY